MALDPETLSEVQASLFLTMHATPLPERGESVARHVFELMEGRGLAYDDVIDALKPVLPPLVRAFIYSPGRQP